MSFKISYYVLLERNDTSLRTVSNIILNALFILCCLQDIWCNCFTYLIYSHCLSPWRCIDNVRINWMLVTSHYFAILHCLCSVNRALDAYLSSVWAVDLLTGISYSGVRFTYKCNYLIFLTQKIAFCRLLHCNVGAFVTFWVIKWMINRMKARTIKELHY